MLDLGIAGAVAVVALVGTTVVAAGQEQSRPLDAGAVTLIVCAAGALGWRRRAPVTVLAVTVVLVAGYLLVGYPFGPIQLCMVFAMFEVARLRGLHTSLLACVVAAVVTAGAILFRALVPADMPLLLLAVWVSWLAVPWAVGSLVQVRTTALRRARRELAARAALEERMRVAGEVHDVAGHGFAAVAMQAGVALLVLDEDAAQARRSLEAIRSTSTQALADLRALLDVSVPADHTGRRLDDVRTLVDNARAAGLPVQLSMSCAEAPQHIEQVVYRVVQEALTNVMRHAASAAARVRIERDPGDAVVVEVRDDGPGAEEIEPGLGLSAMRDRVESAGGDLSIDSPDDGGFRVRARLPVSGGPR